MHCNSNEKGCIFSTDPIPNESKSYYFEVRIDDNGSDGNIVIGLTQKPYFAYQGTDSTYPGSTFGSIVYCCYNGTIYQNDRSDTEQSGKIKIKKKDTIGCMLRREIIDDIPCSFCYFTKNGERQNPVRCIPEGEYYLAIGMGSMGACATPILQDSSFLYKPSEHNPKELVIFKEIFRIAQLNILWSIETKSENISYFGNRVQCTNNEKGCIFSTITIPNHLTSYYFEVRIEDIGKDGDINVGITQKNEFVYQGEERNYPGNTLISIVYKGLDGTIRQDARSEKSGKGIKIRDTIGCMLRREIIDGASHLFCYFTKNGERQNPVRSIPKGEYYLAIGMESMGACVTTNLGDLGNPFLYDPSGIFA